MPSIGSWSAVASPIENLLMLAGKKIKKAICKAMHTCRHLYSIDDTKANELAAVLLWRYGVR
jgi:hypothetical protein